jgi:cytochrome c biogenesis protein CcdA
MIGEFVYPFMAGAVATANPCGFALLPAYIARRLGADTGGDEKTPDGVFRAIALGGAATLGFVLIFGLAGGVVSLGAFWLVRNLPWIGFVIGVVLMIIGLAVLAGKHIRVSLPSAAVPSAGSGLGGDFAFGVGYGAASLSCTLPIFLSVTSTAMTGSPLSSVLSFVAYAVGMGTVLMSLAVAAALARGGLAPFIKRFGTHLYRASGGILFLAGAYVAYYWGFPLFISGLAEEPGLIVGGEEIAGALRNWLGGTVGENFVFGLTALLGVLTVWGFWRRTAPGPSDRTPEISPPGYRGPGSNVEP